MPLSICKILKNILSISLGLLILLQSTGKLWIVISFKLHQDEIARTLCINRNKPELLCSGKCVLDERLQSHDNQEKQQLPVKVKISQEVYYSISLPDFQPAYSIEVVHEDTDKPQFYLSPAATPAYGSIFHPPDLA